MIFDTDILIYVKRGNAKAAETLEKESNRLISIQTYMELLQDAKDQRHHETTINFIKEFRVAVLPLSENIGHRASIYVEEYSLSHNVRAGDAIIAATAVAGTLITGGVALLEGDVRTLARKINVLKIPLKEKFDGLNEKLRESRNESSEQ